MEVEYSGDVMTLNMGPQHPSTHGVLRLELKTDGEIVAAAIPHIGYLHRCFEKHVENVDYAGVVPYTDRMDYCAAMNMELGYVLAVEKLMGIEVNNRVRCIRIVMAELGRIASHLIAAGTYGNDIGSFTPFLWCFRDRERILDMFEETCGARLLYNYNWIGGLMFDIKPGFEDKLIEFLDYFEPQVDNLNRLLSDNWIFIKRTAEVGILSPETAISYGVTGPNLRGSGVKFDVRRDEPYLGYDEFDFEIPVGQGEYGPVGSCWDRYMVRIREVKESCKIIRQAVAKLTPGDVHESIPKRIKPPAGEIYMRTECPRGELGYYIVSDGGLKPYRLKVKSPCFTVMSAFEEVSRGAMISDVIAILGSFDIVLGEIDR
ncbi:MAG: NADH-quinone oxidoreductase subunit D [Acidobacteria bacterium]|nr:NADH-quinone oxidoreductase subunit D [Acidobacteriota bacterium]